MNCVLIGADRLGSIPELLETMGIRVIDHITGRAASHQRQSATLPPNTQLLVLFTDFLNHNAMRSYRNTARQQGIPILACRRSASYLVKELQRFLGPGPRIAGAGTGDSN